MSQTSEKAMDRLHAIWIDILMALLGILQGLIFNDLANKIAKNWIVAVHVDWVVLAHLLLCIAILIRVVQTYITSALYYRKDLSIIEIAIMTTGAILQHILAECIIVPGEDSAITGVVRIVEFHRVMILISGLGITAYIGTFRARIVKFTQETHGQNPSEFLNTVRLQSANIFGLLIVAMLSTSLLVSGNQQVMDSYWPMIAPILSMLILITNTWYSSTLSFRSRSESLTVSDAPQLETGTISSLNAETGTSASWLLVDEFGYFFDNFLPNACTPEAKKELHKQILSVVLFAFDGNHLIGARNCRVITDDKDRSKVIALSIALETGISGQTQVLLKTVFVFLTSIVLFSPRQIFQCLWSVWNNRELFSVPGNGEKNLSIAYIAVDKNNRRRGYAKQLISDLEKRCQSKGLQLITAAVRSSNKAAIALFKEQGFTQRTGISTCDELSSLHGDLKIFYRPCQTQASISIPIVETAKSWRKVKRVLVAGVTLLGLLICLIMFRTMLVTSNQVNASKLPIKIDVPLELKNHLSTLIRYKTITMEDSSRSLENTFDDIQKDFMQWFPLVHKTLSRRIFGAGTLMFQWDGTDKHLPPVMLYAHLDVVPAEVNDWRFDPFLGTADSKFVYGRGALDDKFSVVTILAAAEKLISQQYQPRRTLLIIFGHDEEASGEEGAAKVASALAKESVHLESILDEGGAVVQGSIPGIKERTAAVAVSEKGYLDIEICTAGASGHSSAPPESTAIGILSAAIVRLEQHPPTKSLNPLIRQTLIYAAYEMDFIHRLVFTNLWLTAPIVVSQLEEQPITRALLGTTQAVTMIQGGIKANVLPTKVCATVNFRLYPGNSMEDVVRHVRNVITDDKVTVTMGSDQLEPLPISSMNSSAGSVLSYAIRDTFPDAVLVPIVSPGTTDSRHFANLTDQIFRFSPIFLTDEDLKGIHGVDEKISIENLNYAFSFYFSYIVRSTQ
jgi:carboxypeptidase PM20D1